MRKESETRKAERKLKPPIDVHVEIQTRSVTLQGVARIVGHELTAKQAETMVKDLLKTAKLHATDPEVEG